MQKVRDMSVDIEKKLFSRDRNHCYAKETNWTEEKLMCGMNCTSRASSW